MVRSSPRRGQRSKGLKVKHCVQLTLLLGLGIWLVFQLKHSHEKKAVFEKSTKIVVGDKVVKLGRKDLNPRVQEGTNVKDDIEDEENKNDESFNGGDSVTYDKFGKEIGDVSVLDREEERGEESAVEGNNVKETEGTGNEERNNEDGNKTSNEEAREKNYKGDDASSEVVHRMEEKKGGKVEFEEETKSNSTDQNVRFHEDESGPKTDEFKDSVIKNVSANTTEDNRENGSDDSEQQETKNELDSKTGDKGFSDSNGVLPETNQSISNATETTESSGSDESGSTEKTIDVDESRKSTGYQQTKTEEEENEKVQTSELSSKDESKNKESEKKDKEESSSQEGNKAEESKKKDKEESSSQEEEPVEKKKEESSPQEEETAKKEKDEPLSQGEGSAGKDKKVSSSQEENENKETEKKEKDESSSQELNESKETEKKEKEENVNSEKKIEQVESAEKSEKQKTDEGKSKSVYEQSKSASDKKETEPEKEENNKSQDVKDARTDLETLPESSNGSTHNKVAAE